MFFLVDGNRPLRALRGRFLVVLCSLGSDIVVDAAVSWDDGSDGVRHGIGHLFSSKLVLILSSLPGLPPASSAAVAA